MIEGRKDVSHYRDTEREPYRHEDIGAPEKVDLYGIAEESDCWHVADEEGHGDGDNLHGAPSDEKLLCCDVFAILEAIEDPNSGRNY